MKTGPLSHFSQSGQKRVLLLFIKLIGHSTEYRTSTMRLVILAIALIFCALDRGVLALLRLKNEAEVHGLLLLDSVTFPMFVPDSTNTVVLMVS
jgi:hypothetical protein